MIGYDKSTYRTGTSGIDTYPLANAVLVEIVPTAAHKGRAGQVLMAYRAHASLGTTLSVRQTAKHGLEDKKEAKEEMEQCFHRIHYRCWPG